jgi:hypothetical protein
MEFRHTLEIISKDIQDIEKLLDNFNNYSTIPAIELELALSKLRNIYDLLLLFRDRSIEKPEEVFNDTPEDQNIVNKAQADAKENSELHLKYPPYAEDVMSNILAPDDHSVSGKEERLIHPGHENRDEVSLYPDHSTDEAGKNSSKDSPDNKLQPEQGKKEKEGVILGEKYNLGKKSINENLGVQNVPSNIKIKIQGAPITNIAGTIGINDKFYLIRELFKSDAESFRQTLDILDHSQSFNEAFNYLIENFKWDMESEPAQQLLSLIRRKFISQGNG